MYCRTIKAETDSGTGTPGKKTPGKASASVKTPGTGKVSASVKTPGTGKAAAPVKTSGGTTSKTTGMLRSARKQASNNNGASPNITMRSVTRVDPVTGDLTRGNINQRRGDPGEAEG